MALSRRVAQDAMVVRRLICEGYDVQARNLLRSLDEHLGAIYYLCLKPGACSKFIAAQTEKSANKFWWAHIRGSRKVVEDALSKIVGPEFVQEMSIFRRSEWSMLSSAHHPSYAACTVPFMVPYSDVNASKYIFGAPSEYSYRTGKLLYYMLAEAALFIGALNKDIGGLIKRKRGPALQAFVRRGQLHLVTMLLQLAANWRCPLFDASSEMNALWKNVKHQRIRRAARLKKVRASRQVNLEMVRSMG